MFILFDIELECVRVNAFVHILYHRLRTCSKSLNKRRLKLNFGKTNHTCLLSLFFMWYTYTLLFNTRITSCASLCSRPERYQPSPLRYWLLHSSSQ